MYDVLVFAFLLAVVVCAGVGGWLVLRHEPRRPAFAFGVFMLLMGLWSAAHVGTLSASTQAWHLRFTQLSYVSVVLTPVAWLTFALRYRDRGDLLTRRRLALLLVVPVATLAVVFTAQYHSLLYRSMELVTVAGRPLLETTSGPWHGLNVVYSYALLLVGTGLLVESALTDNRLYRRQSAVLLACSLLPWVVNGAYHVGLRPIPWVDPTPLAFTVVGVPLAAVVVRTDLAAYLPVAHERLFRTLQDPIVVVTPSGQVVDANGAAREVLGEPLVGRPVEAALPATLLDEEGLRPDLAGALECQIDIDGERREFVARRREIEPEPDGPSRGYLLSLTDITIQKTQERALRRQTERLETQTARLERKNEHLERLADIVAHDLRTPLSTAEKLRSLLATDIESPSPAVEQSLADLGRVHERLREFSDHLPKLARESTDVETTDDCDLERVARAAWRVLDTDGGELTITDSRRVQADRRRLQQVLENLFDNALEHGPPDVEGDAADSERPHAATEGHEAADDATAGTALETTDSAARTAEATVHVDVGTTPTGFYVADDGRGIPPSQREVVFDYGSSTGTGSGFGLTIVRTTVEAHGWDIDVTESEPGGARFEIRTDGPESRGDGA